MWNVKDVHLSYVIATLETEHSLVYVGVHSRDYRRRCPYKPVFSLK